MKCNHGKLEVLKQTYSIDTPTWPIMKQAGLECPHRFSLFLLRQNVLPHVLHVQGFSGGASFFTLHTEHTPFCLAFTPEFDDCRRPTALSPSLPSPWDGVVGGAAATAVLIASGRRVATALDGDSAAPFCAAANVPDVDQFRKRWYPAKITPTIVDPVWRYPTTSCQSQLIQPLLSRSLSLSRPNSRSLLASLAENERESCFLNVNI